MAVFADIYLQQSQKPNYYAHQILWPVNMWKVYTKKPRGRQLNLFEKTILQLFSVSGGRSLNNEQIAEWMHLEIDMVSYIITSQLIPNGWLTTKGSVTDEGDKLLDGELNDNLTTAYIFQCAITGQWLPRVSFSLNEIYSCNANGKPKFKLKRASNYIQDPFVLSSSKSSASAPNEHDLKNIMTEYQDAVYIAKSTRDDDQWQNNNTNIDNLTLAAETGTPVYLTVWGDTRSSFEWTIYDPFDISTTSKWMLDLFKGSCKSNSNFGRFALSKLGVGDSKLSYEETCRQFSETAKLKVLVSYSDADKIEGLTDAIFQLLVLKEQLPIEGYSHNTSNTNTINNCVKIFEIVCSYLLRSYPVENPARLPKPYSKNPKVILKCLLVDATKMNDSMINRVMAVNASKVYSAAICRNSSVRAQLAAIFISMETYIDHPLKFMIDNEHYFSNFYNLTHLRDDCSHGDSTRVDKQQVKVAIKTTDTFLNKLFIGIK